VQADRSVTVETAADNAALLEITKAKESGSTTPNADEYVSTTGNGRVVIDVPNANLDAYTTIRDLLDIRNAGTQPVVVGHEQSFAPQKVFFYHDDESYDQAGDEVTGWGTPDNDGVTNFGLGEWKNYPYLESGDTLQNFGMGIGLASDDAEIGEESITLIAATPEELYNEFGAPNPNP
jgi:hypothetical protein